jgi:non-specific serine/threonine protein kinase/serine/threonine-protein kinase
MDEWPKIEALLQAALELPPAERRGFVEEQSRNAPDVRREVESLLAYEERTDGFLGAPALAFSADFFDDEDSTSARAGETVGNYRIIREVGHGGMGAVFLAERADGEFHQQVALKVVRRTFADSELARRFRRERQILASLNHPNIARLLDGGVSAEGEPFFAMEYVEGVRIDDYCATKNLPTEERLKLFLGVCQGVSYAHQHLVVHRDIKPSNILVTSEHTPKLLDFGIAKLLDAEHHDEHTQTAFRAFTPVYASPEQISGASVTTASDVYSLGVLLQDMLGGADAASANVQFPPEAWRSQTPGPKTSMTSVATAAENGSKREHRQRRFMSAELGNIIAMARREEAARRYASVAQFAEDVQSYLDGRPTRAQKDSLTYRVGKFIRRNKLTVGAVAIVALALVIGLAAALWQAGVARRQRDRAERRFNDVRQLSNALLTDIAPRLEHLQGATEARRVLVNQSLKYLDSLAAESGDDPQLQSELASAYEKVGDLLGMPRRANLGDFNGALASYEKARRIRLTLLGATPNDFQLRQSLAANLGSIAYIRWWLSDVSGALIDSEKAIGIYNALLDEKPEAMNLQLAAAEVRIDRADMFYFNDQIAETYPPLQRAIAALETLRRTNAEHVETLQLLARGQTILALTLRFDNRLKEGEVELAKAFAISEALAARYPQDPIQKQALLYTYQQGSQLYQEVDDARAFEIQVKASQVAEDIARSDSANTQARQNLAKSYSLLGMLAVRVKKLDEAIRHLEKSATAFAALEKLEPENRTYKHDIGRVLTFLGQAKYQRRDLAGALASYERASEIFAADARADQKNLFPLRKLAAVYTYMGDTYRDLAQTAGGQQRQAHMRAARENHQRALDVFLELEAQQALTEEDRKYLAEAQANVRSYNRE